MIRVYTDIWQPSSLVLLVSRPVLPSLQETWSLRGNRLARRRSRQPSTTPQSTRAMFLAFLQHYDNDIFTQDTNLLSRTSLLRLPSGLIILDVCHFWQWIYRLVHCGRLAWAHRWIAMRRRRRKDSRAGSLSTACRR
jgi:hypothetical protein